jgi:hypothetical protein
MNSALRPPVRPAAPTATDALLDGLTPAAMRDTIASLEAELRALHAERARERGEVAALREAVASLGAQADAWYAGVERLGGRTVDEAADALASYEAQLCAIYAAADADA